MSHPRMNCRHHHLLILCPRHLVMSTSPVRHHQGPREDYGELRRTLSIVNLPLSSMSLLSRIRWGSPRREGNLALRRPMQCSTQTLKPESLMLKIRFRFGRGDCGGFLYGMIECFVSG